MTDILSISYRLRIFTLRELAEAVDGGNTLQVSKLLQRWQQQGYVEQVRRNLYCMIDLGTRLPVCDKYEIGSHLSESSYISYHTALEFHGFAHQPFNEVFASSHTRFTPFSYSEIEYSYCRQTMPEIGVMRPIGKTSVRVTDLERTLLDCFDRIDRAGGIEELRHCMEGITLIDEKKMEKYLSAIDKSFLYKKTGFMLEQIKEQANISDAFLELCREKGNRSVKMLTNDDESDTFVNRWRLYAPQSMTEKEIGYELI